MNIPESIAKLTVEKPNDPFNVKPEVRNIDVDEVIFSLKKNLNTHQLQSFEKGLLFFKTNITSDKNISQNLIGLISEVITSSLKESNISDDFKTGISLSTKHLLNSINENFEALFKNIVMLNKDKNLLDVNAFTLIILGYALGLLKKINNSRN